MMEIFLCYDFDHNNLVIKKLQNVSEMTLFVLRKLFFEEKICRFIHIG